MVGRITAAFIAAIFLAAIFPATVFLATAAGLAATAGAEPIEINIGGFLLPG